MFLFFETGITGQKNLQGSKKVSYEDRAKEHEDLQEREPREYQNYIRPIISNIGPPPYDFLKYVFRELTKTIRQTDYIICEEFEILCGYCVHNKNQTYRHSSKF